MKQPLSLAFAILILAACNPVPPDTFPGQPVTERIKLFKQFLRNFEPIGLMARDKQPFDAANAIGYAEEVRRVATQPWAHFPPGSDYAPTKAKPAVWEKADEFKRAQENFIASVDKLAAAARTRNKDALRTAYEDTYDNCSSCHKAFKR
jgi:cytochrome c556